MKLLDRYVFRQVLGTAALAVAILSVVLVLGNVFKQALDLLVNHNVAMEFIFDFVAYIFPYSLTFTIPWGFLTAVLLVFGRMSAENELIALRSNGLSMARVCMPVMAMAVMLVGVCLWINLDVAPRAQVKMKNALYNMATNNPLAMFSSDKVIDEFPGRKIFIERSSGSELQNVLVYELGEDFQPMKVVFAKRGFLETDRENNQLLFRLFDARFEQRDDQDPTNLAKIRQGIVAQQIPLSISLKELYEKNKKRDRLSAMTLEELQERLRGGRAEAEGGSLKDERDQTRHQQSITNARTEVSKRFSFAMASFALGLIGIPLAITAHRKETSAGFALSLAVAFAYFFLLTLADVARSHPKWHPELLIWAPNVIFITAGVWMFWRLNRR